MERKPSGHGRDVFGELTVLERQRRRKRLLLVVPVLAGLLLVSVIQIARPAMLYNAFHPVPLRPGQGSIVLGLELRGGARVVYQAVREPGLSDADYAARLDQIQAFLQERIATFGHIESNISVDRRRGIVLVELPGVENRDLIASLIGETGKLEFALVSDSAASRLGIGDPLSPADRVALILDRSDLSDASIEQDPATRKSHVALKFREGREQAIQAALAQHRGHAVAITISGNIRALVRVADSYSATAGGTTIIGNEQGLSELEVARYQRLFRWEALPLELRQVETEFISPAMGEEQLLAAYAALAFGAVLVVTLLLVFYGTYLGAVGCIALFYYGLLIWATFSSMGMVLTLPGMAGLLLTLGISVDSFILVFERIKDELRTRMKNHLEPFDEDAIWDSMGGTVKRLVTLRLTTAAGAVVLLFGEGAVRGFGASMLVGLAAEWVVASRPVLGGLIVLFLQHGARVSRWTYGFPAFEGPRLERLFRGALRHKHGVSFASLCVMSGLAFFVYLKPPALGVDFGGGTQVRAVIPTEVSRDRIRAALVNGGLGDQLASLQHGLLASEEAVLPWILSFHQVAEDGDRFAGRVHQALAAAGIQSSMQGVWQTGPRVPARVLGRWLLFLGLALAVIGIYCMLPWSGLGILGTRFWPAAAVMLVACHDLVVVAGLMAVTRSQLDMSVVMGLFILLGYTMNDSLVLVWHVGQETARHRSQPVSPQIVEEMIVRIRSRTMIASLTTVAAVLPITLFAGGSFNSYALVIIGGVAVGTFSTVFLLGSCIELLVGWRTRPAREPAVALQPSI